MLHQASTMKMFSTWLSGIIIMTHREEADKVLPLDVAHAFGIKLGPNLLEGPFRREMSRCSRSRTGLTHFLPVQRRPPRHLIYICERLDDNTRKHIDENIPGQGVSIPDCRYLRLVLHAENVPADKETKSPRCTTAVRMKKIFVLGAARHRNGTTFG